ncbi:Bdr family repetitive protein (plasmid) [Borreliella japonica]|uniref:Bdr family repetitive protein n=1 Tax=Borreliella japonica TaxID=34095 RepID=UPI000B8150D3|nr:Bdr family repetitive protein [Borreliella japonica]
MLEYRTYNIESIKSEFLNIGFSEEAIDFVFLHNDNYNFEFLKKKLIDVEKNLNAKIDFVKSEFNIKIDFVEKNLDSKIDNVERNFNIKIDNLDIKINTVEKNLRKDLNMGNRVIHFMVITAAIFGPFINSFLMKYIQGFK